MKHLNSFFIYLLLIIICSSLISSNETDKPVIIYKGEKYCKYLSKTTSDTIKDPSDIVVVTELKITYYKHFKYE